MTNITTYEKAIANVLRAKINDDLEIAIPEMDIDWIRKYAGKEEVFIEIGGKKIEVGDLHATICQKVIEQVAVNYYKELAESVGDESWNSPHKRPKRGDDGRNSWSDIMMVKLPSGKTTNAMYNIESGDWVEMGTGRTLYNVIGWK